MLPPAPGWSVTSPFRSAAQLVGGEVIKQVPPLYKVGAYTCEIKRTTLLGVISRWLRLSDSCGHGDSNTCGQIDCAFINGI